jgi:hypothetical protein
MGWTEVAARSHARRLETEGWLGRVAMLWGQGSMFYVTKLGVRVLGTGLGAQPAPQPNWWAHHSACACTAAWLTVRERRFLGEPEIRHSGEWAERLTWYDSRGWKKSGHRPDLIAWAPDDSVHAIEVELARKAKARLNAILSLHNTWMLHGKVGKLVYIVGDADDARRIRRAMERNVFLGEGRVRVESLEVIKRQTVEGFEAERPKRARSAEDDQGPALRPATIERSGPIIARDRRSIGSARDSQRLGFKARAEGSAVSTRS